MTNERLKQTIKSLPAKPGVYLFRQKGVPIYIGKAAALKARLGSYLKTMDPRIQKMISVANKVDYIETDSEIEALILESQLIKQKQPMFNIMLRDDKQYFYVAFTKDDFPRIFLTHQPSAHTLSPNIGKPVPSVSPFPSATGLKGRASVDYIGPFTEGTAIKGTLRLLRTLFPYCTCVQKHHNYCLNYHIGKCPGVCCLRHEAYNMKHITAEKNANVTWDMIHVTYTSNIKAIKSILSGKRTTVIKELRTQMDALARDEKLEEAIALRTKIEKLERIFENARIIKSSAIIKNNQPFLHGLIRTNGSINRIEGYDISNIQGKHATGSMVTFVNGEPDKNFYRKFNIKTRREGDVAALQEIIDRRLNHDEWPFPDLIVVDGGKAQVNTFRSVLQERDIKIPVVGLVKDNRHVGTALIIPDKKEAIPLTKLTPNDRNLLLAIDAEAHRFAIQHYRKRHRKTIRD